MNTPSTVPFSRHLPLDYLSKCKSMLPRIAVVSLVIVFSAIYLFQPSVREILKHVYFIPVGISGFLFGFTRASGLALFGFCLACCVGFANFSETTTSEFLGIIVWGCALGATGGFLGILATHYNQRVRQVLEKQSAEALTDPLTSIANRRAFEFELNRRMSDEQPENSALSVLIIDIDHFRQFNEKYGRKTGDSLLTNIAQVIFGCLRGADLLARFGGEKFAILIPGTAVDNTKIVAERIRARIEKRGLSVGGMRFQLRVSIGGAVVRRNDTCETFVNRAKEALYAAKQMGRNRVIFFEDSDATTTALQPTSFEAYCQFHEQAQEEGNYCDPITRQTYLKVFLEEFRRRANEANRYEHPLSLGLIDITNHADFSSRGEDCIKHVLGFVADRFKHVIRDSDLITWRRADQFAILCPQTSLNDTRIAIHRILAFFAEGRAPIHKGKKFSIELTARISELLPGETSVDLMKRCSASAAFRHDTVGHSSD